MRGDKASTAAATSRAYRAYDSTRGHDQEWVFLPDAELVGITGRAQRWLGDHDAATTHFQAAIDSSSAWPRERAGWQLNLAENLVSAGDIAQACSVLTDKFDTISSLASTRLRQRIDAIANTVRAHAAIPEVREFLGRRAARV
ncbi:hypothetical protein [Nocardia amamiensis]|uniref:hypothetical protein n=1 Tax=Nocardia amamiensis TaxID=404578 RepID=UPI0033C14E95